MFITIYCLFIIYYLFLNSISLFVSLISDSFERSYTGWAKKTGPFLRVYKFATVGARNARYMSKFSKFYLEKYIKLACQCV